MKFFKTLLACFLALVLFSFLVFFLPIIGLMAIAFSTSDTSSKIPEGSILMLNLNGQLKDRQSIEDMPFNWLEENDYKVYYMDDLMTVLDAAAKDNRIKGISIEMGELNCGMASIAELKQYLEDFKKSGKFVYAYSGNYSQKNYYLATAADSIFLNPQGTLDFKGLSSASMFYKGILDKLGVEMQIIKVGAYKSFTEQYSSDSMSVENRAQSELLIHSIWKSVLEGISGARNLSVEVLNQYADDLLYFDYPSELKEKGMIDGICYRNDFLHKAENRSGLSVPVFVKYKDYLNEVKGSEASKMLMSGDKIAVVFAEGDIDNGTNDGIHSGKFENMLWDIADDESVRAVVLRVNSPGGSAYGAEQIWRALQCVRAQKPVIVSMGDYAASGGYYISTAANYIVANPSTITGSIGVFSVIPNLDSLSKKLGVSLETVNTNENSDFGTSIMTPLSDDMKQKMQEHTERVYDIFLQRCADGRGLSIDSVKSLAEGRVWSGQSAYELGLVDKLGTLDDAIQLASEKAGLPDYNLEFYPKKKDFMTELSDMFEISQKKLGLSIVFSKESAIFEQIRQIDRFQALMPIQFEIR